MVTGRSGEGLELESRQVPLGKDRQESGGAHVSLGSGCEQGYEQCGRVHVKISIASGLYHEA